MTRLSDLQNKKPITDEATSSSDTSREIKEDLPAPDELTDKLLASYWLEFAEQLKNDQPRLYSTLTSQIPELSADKKIVLKLNNILQEKAIRSIQTELLQFLRAKSGHRNLEMLTDIPLEQTEKKLYTKEEKYQHLQQKNPDLDLFRQSLGLDFE
jgi:DNA polymerase-3 subunit gamma/tau